MPNIHVSLVNDIGQVLENVVYAIPTIDPNVAAEQEVRRAARKKRRAARDTLRAAYLTALQPKLHAIAEDLQRATEQNRGLLRADPIGRRVEQSRERLQRLKRELLGARS